MKLFLGVFLLLVLSVVEAVVIQVEDLPERCDFRKCTAPDPSKLNVHLVPHTHDDVGWLKTVDEYFFGLNVSIQNAGVQYILDSVVSELIKNKERRFIYVETAFFWKWWRLQSEHQREIVKELVKTGQLEFIGGGWSMNDEATSHYSAIVDQMTWGHRRLRDTFGRCGVPKVAWQIDPFGHSKEQANLFAAMNFDALFFAREDYQDRAKRAASKTLEHVWQASQDLGKAGDLFTGMMYMGYGPPSKFNWDLIAMSNQDTPVVDDPDSEEYNVPAIVEKFTASAKAYAAHYATNSILYPMGTDFQYQAAGTWYSNLDRLIKALEKSPDIKVFYSTPSCYAKALHDTKRKWTSKTDDYFPYANAEHSYWTGYFTSRPAVKYMERYGNNVLQACKQVASLAALSTGSTEDFLRREKKLTKMREWMGVLQHHDAITGTEKQHVAYDYAKNLNSALNGCIDLMMDSYSSSLLPKQSPEASTDVPVLQQVYCSQLNESACAATETARPFIVSIFNPIGHQRVGHLIKLPVTNVDTVFYSVTGPKGEEVVASLVAIPEYVQSLPGRKSRATYELVFRVDLPPLGLATYFVSVSSTRSASSAPKATETRITKQTVLSGQTVKVVFGDDGSLDRLELPDGRSLKLAVDFQYFRGHTGNNIPDSHRASGAYVFRPTDDQKTLRVGQITKAELFASNTKTSGNLGVAEVHLQYDSFVNLVVRIDSTADLLELDWVVGPIDIKDGLGKEVILRVSLPDLVNNRTFWTDANGRQMLERKWNYRPTWRLNVSEPVSGNYYPVVSRIALVDEKKGIQATLMNDRSQGGTSRTDGELELMVHRRLLHDDDFGVGEALNETGVSGKGLVVRGRHILLVGPKATAARDHRLLGVELLLQPVTTFIVNDNLPETVFRKYFNTEVAGLTAELPANVHLMTVEQWKGEEDRLLLRLEHIFQKGEDAELSKPATVHLRNLFTRFEVMEARELTLSANADVAALKDRLVFDYTPIGNVSTPVTEPVKGDKLTVTLHPMQIRTFEVVVRRL